MISICTVNGSITVPGTVKKHVPSAGTPGSMTTWCHDPAGHTMTTGASNREPVIWSASGPCRTVPDPLVITTLSS